MDPTSPSKQPLLSDMDTSRISVKINDEEIALDNSQLEELKDMLKHGPRPREHSNLDNMERASTTTTKEFDYNHYATKKTIATGLLDVCLIATQSAQLKAVIQTGKDNEFAGFLVTFLIFSLLLEIAVGAVLCIVARTNLNTHNAEKRRWIDRFNNLSIALVLAITIVNVMISAFGISNNPKYLIEQRIIENALKNPNNTYQIFNGRR